MVRAALLANAQDSRLVEEDLPPDRDVTAADVRGFQKKRLLRLNPFWRRGLIHTARGVARKGIRPSEPTPRSPAVSLPEDVFDLFGLGHPHWLGNLNVFINRKPVERHLGRALRVYAGQNNLAMFLVGDRRSDRYRFSFGNCPEGWQRALYLPGGRSVAREWCTASSKIHEGDWLPLPGLSTVMLAIRPPAQAGSGEIAVIVEQSSTGQRAQVEFSLDPSAKGAGCYVLD
jgi:hypothetical protein